MHAFKINRLCDFTIVWDSCVPNISCITRNPIIISIKNNCLMKSEVGMGVLKSKQTRVVGVNSIYV